MRLISVDFAKHTSGVAIELGITADLQDGAGPQSLPYGWVRGDIFGLGPQIDAYMTANPGLPIAAYVPPVIDLNAIDLQTLNDALAQPGSVVRALALLMLQRINALDAAINTLNTKTGLAGNNLPIFTQAQLVTALQALMR